MFLAYNIGLSSLHQRLQGGSRIASIGFVWFQFYNTFIGWACVDNILHLENTIINITYCSNCTLR